MRKTARYAFALLGLALSLGGCGPEECVAVVQCVEECGGPVLATECSCPGRTFDRATCPMPDAGPSLLSTVELVGQRGDGSDTSGSEELCVTLRSDPEVIVDSVRFLSANWVGPIRIPPEGVELCQTGCWCFAPSGNEVLVRRGREEVSFDGGSGACCG